MDCTTAAEIAEEKERVKTQRQSENQKRYRERRKDQEIKDAMNLDEKRRKNNESQKKCRAKKLERNQAMRLSAPAANPSNVSPPHVEPSQLIFDTMIGSIVQADDSKFWRDVVRENNRKTFELAELAMKRNADARNRAFDILTSKRSSPSLKTNVPTPKKLFGNDGGQLSEDEAFVDNPSEDATFVDDPSEDKTFHDGPSGTVTPTPRNLPGDWEITSWANKTWCALQFVMMIVWNVISAFVFLLAFVRDATQTGWHWYCAMPLGKPIGPKLSLGVPGTSAGIPQESSRVLELGVPGTSIIPSESSTLLSLGVPGTSAGIPSESCPFLSLGVPGTSAGLLPESSTVLPLSVPGTSTGNPPDLFTELSLGVSGISSGIPKESTHVAATRVELGRSNPVAISPSSPHYCGFKNAGE